MKVLNLKKYGRNEVSFYLALEQHILSNLDDDVFFLWDIPPSIVIGRNQLIDSEVNINYVNSKNVKVYRRPSGGGAVYADTGCFMYSFITKEKNKEVLYHVYLSKLMEVLKSLGLDVYFSGRNDLLYNGKKFSGTALLQTKDGSVLHGTFLYNTNINHLVKSLNVDPSKIISKGIQSVKQRVINLKPYLSFTKKQLMDYLNNNMGSNQITLSIDDYQLVKEIEKKYLSDEWIKGQNPRFTFHNKKRFSFGLLDVYLLIKNEHIMEMEFKGDFFEKKNLEAFYPAFINNTFTKSDFNKILEENPIGDYIYDAKNENLIELLFGEEK